MDSFTFDAHATFPLTHFDRLFERTTFLTGWLVEGTIDTVALASALARITQKWRMLSGRLESMKDENDACLIHLLFFSTISDSFRRTRNGALEYL